MIPVTLHLSDSPLTGIYDKWSRWRHGVPLKHVSVQAGDYVFDSSPRRGTYFAPAAPWVRTVKPYMSVQVAEVQAFDWHDHEDLCGLPVSPMRILIADIINRPSQNCVTHSIRFLNRLGINTPHARTPQDLCDWRLS